MTQQNYENSMTNYAYVGIFMLGMCIDVSKHTKRKCVLTAKSSTHQEKAYSRALRLTGIS